MACLPAERGYHANHQSSKAGRRFAPVYRDSSYSPPRKVLHQEAKTFSHRSAAERWGKHREVALEDPSALVCAQQPSTKLIRWYIDTFQDISKWQRSKQSQLLFLEKHSIGDVDAEFLESGTLVDHVRSRRAKGAGPTTVSNDLTWIGVVMRAAKSVKGLPVHPEVVDDACTACRELRLIGKSRRRERRPTATALTKLDDYFARRDGRSRIPMRDIMWFAIHSARRKAEICRLEWADNHQRSRTGLVRDAKHPRHKEGNHRRFKFTAEAWLTCPHFQCQRLVSGARWLRYPMSL